MFESFNIDAAQLLDFLPESAFARIEIDVTKTLSAGLLLTILCSRSPVFATKVSWEWRELFQLSALLSRNQVSTLTQRY